MDTGEQVAIIGGGISGLSAAYELSRRGIPFRLFERSDHLGGVIRTDVIDGFTIDGGPDSLLTQKPAAIALCEELGLGPRLQPTLPPRDGVCPEEWSPLSPSRGVGPRHSNAARASGRLAAPLRGRQGTNGAGVEDSSVDERPG